MLFDSIYMKSPEWENLYTERRLVAARSWGRGEWLLMGVGFLSEVIRMFWI